MTGTGWEKFCGDKIPDQEYLAYLIPTWGIETMLETKTYDDGGESKPLYERDIAWYNLWKKHLVSAFDAKEIVKNNYANECFITTKLEQAIAWISDAMNWKFVSFDYETNSIKSYRKGSKIICASISDGLFSYSFPFFNDEKFRKAWKTLMLSTSGKISHNLQFEATWTKCKEGSWPNNWEWDTMLGQHAYHNQKPTGLKYCTYVQMGDIGYDDSVDKYLSPDKHERDIYGTHAFNRLEEAPLEDVLLYNALDSLYTYKLYAIQKAALTEFQVKGVKFLIESAVALAKASHEGFLVDQKAFDKAESDASIFQAKLKEELMALPEIKMWDLPEPLNIDAPAQMAHLFFDILKYKPISFTTKGHVPSVNKNFLEKSDTTFTRKLIEYRETVKMLGTYIADYRRENMNGYIHTSFMLNTVDTYRSSSKEPNVQSLPKRRPEVKKLLRSFLIPQPGAKIIEYDYKALEVCFSGETLVSTLSGDKCIRDLNTNDHVFGYDTSKQRISIQPISWVGRTAKQQRTYTVELDNGEKIICTPEHKFMLRDTTYLEAKNLLQGMSLMPLYISTKKSGYGVNYKWVNLNNGCKMSLHNMIAEDVFGVPIKGSSFVVHHKDSNGCNNSLSNLEVMTRKEHMNIHSIQGWRGGNHTPLSQEVQDRVMNAIHKGNSKWHASLTPEDKQRFYEFAVSQRRSYKKEGNPNYGKKMSEETRNKIREKAVGREVSEETRSLLSMRGRSRWSDPEYRERMKGRAPRGSKQKRLNAALLVQDPEYNHKVVGVYPNKELQDVYCITVEGTNNFALSAGVIVHNCINGTHSKDPNMKKYIVDSTTDMHRDSAMDCFILEASEVKKDWRSACKSLFTFSIFYGSYYKNMAKNLWEYVNEVGLINHLNEKGVKTYQQYEDKIKEAERIFWEERFPKHNEWRKQMWKDYQKRGYLDSFTGFRMQAPMKRNNSFNCKVQGDAYHVLQWVMNRVTDICEKKKLRSRPIGEIHDALIMNVYPEEEDIVDYIVWLYGTVKVREYWDWIDLPLTLEKESSKVNGSWADMKSCGSLQFE
jgi:DNA polymerase I-like protein with 3'-5' exonuclease and polymerase domains